MAEIYAHVRECDGNGIHQRFYIGNAQAADVADAKAICVAEFAWVDHKALLAQTFIKIAKIKARVVWIQKGTYDVTPVAFTQIR